MGKSNGGGKGKVLMLKIVLDFWLFIYYLCRMKVSATISIDVKTKEKLSKLRMMPTPDINAKIENLILETAEKFKVK